MSKKTEALKAAAELVVEAYDGDEFQPSWVKACIAALAMPDDEGEAGVLAELLGKCEGTMNLARSYLLGKDGYVPSDIEMYHANSLAVAAGACLRQRLLLLHPGSPAPEKPCKKKLQPSSPDYCVHGAPIGYPCYNCKTKSTTPRPKAEAKPCPKCNKPCAKCGGRGVVLGMSGLGPSSVPCPRCGKPGQEG